ncbi:MAG TPA: SGNH/GDSL hydrolase family protein [Myxococcaceae bacterium]|nr:SGNH/GDSL hydrolase family protein [Myxococcaceae bacterium]
MREYQTTYVAMGDSAGVGVGARAKGGGYVARLHRRLLAAGYGTQLRNLCVTGAVSGGVARRQAPEAVRVASAGPTLSTLAIGGNDVWRGVSPRAYGRNLDIAVAQLRATGALLVMANVPDLSYAPLAAYVPRALYDGRIQALNEEVAKVAQHHGVPLVDLYGHSQLHLPGRPDLFSVDGFHPSAAGYELWAEAMWPEVLAAAERLQGAGLEALAG